MEALEKWLASAPRGQLSGSARHHYVLIWANHAYAILRHELANVGAKNPGPKALEMVSLGNPELDWVSLAKGMGVEGRRVETVDELVRAFRAGIAVRGPFLIEVVL